MFPSWVLFPPLFLSILLTAWLVLGAPPGSSVLGYGCAAVVLQIAALVLFLVERRELIRLRKVAEFYTRTTEAREDKLESLVSSQQDLIQELIDEQGSDDLIAIKEEDDTNTVKG